MQKMAHPPCHRSLCIVLLLLAAAASSLEPVLAPNAAHSPATDAVKGLLTRLDPTLAKSTLDQFEFTIIDGSTRCSGKTKLCFAYSSTPNGVSFEGTTGVELAMALNMYLKMETNSSVSWPQTGGSHINIPTDIPRPKKKVHTERSTTKHYYANVCTFSYSFVWYTLEDWVREIDWMALNGVNLPLAFTGQERIYPKVWYPPGASYCPPPPPSQGGILSWTPLTPHPYPHAGLQRIGRL
jgi:alpha-N-acetylglucosaminidase